MKLKNIAYLALGCAGLALGVVGAVVPLVPSVPFLLVAAWGFARSSERLDAWFRGTRVYRDNLEGYVRGEGMPVRAKVRIMATVTVLMAVAFVLMDEVAVGRMALAMVWVLHILYFTFFVKTREAAASSGAGDAAC